VLCAWAGVRAWSAKRRTIRWGGAATASLLIVILSLIGGAAANGLRKMHLRDAPLSELKVDADSAQIRRGQAISDSFCGACHSRTGTLTGGVDLGKDLSHRLGSFVSSNLTPAGPLQHWSDGQIFRAIRNGIGADGRWLVVMSLTNAGKLSDDDTRALIAYMRQLPADGEPTPDPPDSFNFLGLLLLGAGQFPTEPSPRRPRARPWRMGNISCPTTTAADATVPTCTAAWRASSGRSGQTSMSSKAGHATASSRPCAPGAIRTATNSAPKCRGARSER
jgi:cytochrome c553